MKVNNEEKQSDIKRFGENIKRRLLHFVENWPIKIICLVFAVLLSQFYRETLLEKRYLIVPLTVKNEGTLTPAEQYPSKVKVSVWGNASTIGSIGEEDVSAYIDISAFTTDGIYRVPIQTKLNGTLTPLGTIEINTDPSMLSLKLETCIRKQVPVVLSLKGIPADGYEVTESSVDPATAEIEGPAELIEKITELVTEPLSIESRTNGFSGTAAIVNDNPLLSINGKTQVSHTVKIAETTMHKQFNNVPLYFTTSNRDFSITADKKTARFDVQGPKKLLETWNPPENILTVSCEAITEPGVYTLPVEPILPVEYAKLKILSFTPKSVQVTVEALAEKQENTETDMQGY